MCYIKDAVDNYVILWLYIDDILIIDNNNQMIRSIKNMLNLKFNIKDMGLGDLCHDH